MKGKTLSILILFILFAGSTHTIAQEMSEAAIHGFGGWGFGVTDDNAYLIGEKGREYDHINFSFTLSANPSENLRINSLIEFNSGEVDGEEGIQEDLGYAFAEWEFSEALMLRIGLVKHPFGIYTELFNVGTLRPFFTLPTSIYGPAGNVAEAYKGIGFSGSRYGDSWDIEYDVYGGEIAVEAFNPKGFFAAEGTTGELSGEEPNIKDMLGGRLNVYTPIEGVNFGFSGFYGTEEEEEEGEEAGEEEGEEGEKESNYTYGTHGQYTSDKWSVRSEIVRHVDGDGLEINALYLESAYYLTKNWQGALRYEWTDATLPDEIDISKAPSLLDHKEFAVGINYWFNPNFVLKFSYHNVDGNRFAQPELEELEEGEIEEKTNLIVFGAHFSF